MGMELFLRFTCDVCGAKREVSLDQDVEIPAEEVEELREEMGIPEEAEGRFYGADISTEGWVQEPNLVLCPEHSGIAQVTDDTVH